MTIPRRGGPAPRLATLAACRMTGPQRPSSALGLTSWRAPEEAAPLGHFPPRAVALPNTPGRPVLRCVPSPGREIRSGIRHQEPPLVPPLVDVPEGEIRVLPPLAKQEGGPANHIGVVVGRVPLEAVQSLPKIEVGLTPKYPSRMNKNHDLCD